MSRTFSIFMKSPLLHEQSSRSNIVRYQNAPSIASNISQQPRGAEGMVSDPGSFQRYGEEDSSEWVWSSVPNSNGKAESKSSAVAATSKSEKNKNAGDLLIDFGENKAKKATPSLPKVKSAEEEAWDMLNS